MSRQPPYSMPLLFGAALVAVKAQVAPPVVEVRLDHGRFVPARLKVPPRGVLKLINVSDETYTVEGAGALPGDIRVPPRSERVVPLSNASGQFYAVIEEHPEAELTLDLEGDRSIPPPGEPLFDAARRTFRQPLVWEPGREPAYAAYSAFNLVGVGEEKQQTALRELYLAQEALSGEEPPDEFRPYFGKDEWKSFRMSISMVFALGSGAYDAKRFGPRVAKAKPAGLRPIGYASLLGVHSSEQRDLLVRVASDRHWFNLRAIRWIWSRLRGRIGETTLESGYANPNGRSPILGGFFDGTGNPYGEKRELAVFGPQHGNGTYLALFRIGFDEEQFRRLSLAERQRIVGREKDSGKPLRGADEAAHRSRAGMSDKVTMLRQPFVFDDGPTHTGLLFASLQASPDALDQILRGFMSSGKRKDLMLRFMRFETATLYYAPSSPKGSFPGSLRFGGR